MTKVIVALVFLFSSTQVWAPHSLEHMTSSKAEFIATFELIQCMDTLEIIQRNLEDSNPNKDTWEKQGWARSMPFGNGKQSCCIDSGSKFKGLGSIDQDSELPSCKR